MRVLFIGGTGVISSACSDLAVAQGVELFLLNRGGSLRQPAAGARQLHADIRDPSSVRTVIGSMDFDVVVDWIAYTPDHVDVDLELFRGRTGQYVLISSASVYETPPARLPVVESTPLSNPFWQYSRDKIACEERAQRAHRDEGFPITIVRPAHTYDRTKLPIRGSYTMVDRMRRGLPVVVQGDGTSLWTLTHHADFARGFIPLLGNPAAIGEAFHITSDDLLTWNQIYLSIAGAAGVEPHMVHVPSDWIARFDPEWGGSLLGDKAHSMIFDNSKLRSLVPGFAAAIPFHQGAQEILTWFDQKPERRVVDADLNRTLDEIVAAAAGVVRGVS
jgi:nucleoside-diphosphate-sugar epimerase